MMHDGSFSAQELAGITSSPWENGTPEGKNFTLSTDTRCDNRGKIFFALAGERFDAHDFLDKAVASGAAGLCADRKKIASVPQGIPFLAVDDTLKAYQSCGAYHRKRFPQLTLFGVTGSVGKTSVKEMLRAICDAAYQESPSLCTEGNTNNQIGVVQNLLRLSDSHRYAVIEAGTSSPGEIAPLSRIMQPIGAIVNSIAPCHLEKLIDLDGVATEKSRIFDFLPPNGVAVFPENCAGKNILRSAAGKRKILTFGLNGTGDVSVRLLHTDMEKSSFELLFPGGEKFTVNWKLTGEHNALNAAGAAALAYACGIESETICSGLSATSLPGMRMKRTVFNGVTFFNDAYNANPASMAASIKLLSGTILPGRLILVLGGMRELGDISETAHKELLESVCKLLPEALVITIGEEFAPFGGNFFARSEEAENFLINLLKPGDTVFAKGSRGNAVEKALPPEVR